jgi:methylenetetrahydrofolate dehydrogenase (NADP+) / methenyltetrahydrofolate cyclohydrolase
MVLLDGKKISAEIQQELAQKISVLKSEEKKIPHLAAVLIGNDAASETYVAAKVKACEKIGFGSSLIRKEIIITEEELLALIKQLNDDERITGILIQLPLPHHIHSEKITEAMNPKKDVDGFHPVNVGRMVKGFPCHLPATPFGILTLLERYQIETFGKHCVVIGRSDIVGTPMSILMSRNHYPGNCTVTICHSKTKNLQEITLQADILIAAIGKPEFVKADMVRYGAVIVDVGIHRMEDATKKSGFRLVGDVNFENVAPKCSYITPVPGGVGPMTIAALLMNTMNSVNLVY